MRAVITTNGDCPTRQAELAREWWAREFLTTEFNLLFDPHSFALPFLCPFPSPHGDSAKRSRNRPTEREQPGDPCQAPRLFQFGGGDYATELAQVAGRKTRVIEQTLGTDPPDGGNRTGQPIDRSAGPASVDERPKSLGCGQVNYHQETRDPQLACIFLLSCEFTLALASVNAKETRPRLLARVSGI